MITCTADQTTKDKILLQKHIDELNNRYLELSKDYDVMAVLCYGSQNYHLDTERSDFDTRAIILPSLRDLIKGERVSRTMTFNDGECDIKDVQSYIENLKKQNVTFVETLYTDIAAVNPSYKGFFDTLINQSDDIARYDRIRSLDAFLGILRRSEKELISACSTS